MFGIDVDGKTVHGDRVMERIKSERDRFVGFVERAVDDWPEHHKLHGKAVFIGPNELQVGDHTRVHAERIVIAAGSRPAVPPPWHELGDRLLVNDDVFAWDTLPGSVVVVGTGVIGMEISQALSRLGVKTHLFGIGNQFGPLSDPLINAEVGRFLGKELTLEADAKVESVRRGESGVEIEYLANGATHTVTADYMLAATGRRSNIDSLDLNQAGIAVNQMGIPEFKSGYRPGGRYSGFYCRGCQQCSPLAA